MLCLFGGYSKEKLNEIFEDCNTTGIDYKTFFNRYIDAVSKPHNFFY